MGGALLLAAAVIALVWANSPWSSSYDSLGSWVIGPQVLHLDLSLALWASDGLLAIFFFVAGLELRRELVAGDLRDPARALLPVVAAVAGVVVPAVVYLVVTAGDGSQALRGWAVPTATDIAFALAVLAVVGRGAPAALRTFLLTLAVVDDLIAIVVIALFYSGELAFLPAIAAVPGLAIFAFLIRRPAVRTGTGTGPARALLLVALAAVAVVVWALVHASGVHATVAGILLAFCVPFDHPNTDSETDAAPDTASQTAPDAAPDTAPDAGPGGKEAVLGIGERIEHRLRPVSAGLAVPVFAFLTAGVAVSGSAGPGTFLDDRAVLGIVLGLVVGKPVGILAAVWITTRFSRVSLGDDITRTDLTGLALLGGVGFTVSLLIGELAFGAGSARADRVTVAVLVGSLLSAAFAAAVLAAGNRRRPDRAVASSQPTA